MKELPTICLISHTDYSLKMRSSEMTLPFGEINNAKKLHNLLRDGNFPVTDVLDIYELFGIQDINDENGSICAEMTAANISIGCAGIDFITDYQNHVAETFRKNIRHYLKHVSDPVLFFLSWPGKSLAMLSTGIQHDYPTIGKEDSYIAAARLPERFPIEKYSQEVDLITSESLLGAINLHECGVPSNKFIYLPNLAPFEAKVVNMRPIKDRYRYKEAYIKRVAERNHKSIRYDEKTLVIGYPSRFVRRKNIESMIYAIAELTNKYPNLLLILKGDMDSEFDIFSLYSEKLYQLLKSAEKEPWFLWDRDFTPFPEVLNIYASFDLCAFLSGAELGCNTIVELCSLGVPLILQEASVNPYLYRGMAEFVKGGELCDSTWFYSQPDLNELIEKLENLILNEEKRRQLGQNARNFAQERFGLHQHLERIPLMTQAAKSFFYKDGQAKIFEEKILKKLDNDFKDYQVFI